MKFENKQSLGDKLKRMVKDSDESTETQIVKYVEYCWKLRSEKGRDGKLKNPWMGFKELDELAAAFMTVRAEGLVFDGVHITWQSTGLNYDYVI